MSRIWKLACLLGRGVKFLWKEYHFLVPFSMWKKYFIEIKDKTKRAVNGLPIVDPMNKAEYNKWLLKNNSYEKNELSYQPLISVIIPVYNASKEHLTDCIESVLNQTYRNFEICIVDDASTNKETIECLKQYEKNEYCKIIFQNKNMHISNTSNRALSIAKGEFIALVDNDDTVDKDALYENVKLLNANKSLDIIYSDEDKIDFDGKYCEPHFKPDFSPDTLLSLNYICHLCVIRKTLIDEVGGFRTGIEGAQDYDLILRITENTERISHISKILYHWRKSKESTAGNISNKEYVVNNTLTVLNETLSRRGIVGSAKKDNKSDFYYIDYHLDSEPSVSIIIPIKDAYKITSTCLNSIFTLTDYSNYEVVVVDNNSKYEKTQTMLDSYSNSYNNFRVIKAQMEFNYSRINNLAIRNCDSDVIVLLNNDTKIISSNWLQVMVGYAIQEHIGAVGPKLLYEDDTIQHGGVLLGLQTIASHAYLGQNKNAHGSFGRLCVPYNYSAVTAACLAIEKKKIEDVGYLDERLKVAYNDIDLNLRLLKKGYYNVFLPHISVYHLESKSRGLDTTVEKYNIFKKEEAYMLKKHADIIPNDPFYNKNYSKCCPEANFFLDK